MRRSSPLIPLAALLVLGLVAGTAEATNGYFSHGYGTPYKSVAGAGVALRLNTLAPATNPAAMVWVGRGFDVEMSLFNPNRDFTVNGAPSGFPGTFGLAPGTVESDSLIFLIPGAGANWMLTEDDSLGVTLYGNGGMNTTYASPVFGAGATGVDLAQMFLAPTYSRRLGNHSLGVSGILAYQRFEAKGLAAFGQFSMDPAHLTNMEHDSSFGYGARLGYLGQWWDQLAVGASFQTEISMGELESYSGLFAEGGSFDIPKNWTLGVVVTPVDALDIAFDVQRVYYSDVPAVANPMLPNMMSNPMGAALGPGFGWNDVTAYKAGLQFHKGSWTWRGGYSHADQPVPSDDVLFNILAPGIVEDHATFGLSKAFEGGRQIHLSITRAFSKSVSGGNPLEVPELQDIDLRMDQWELSIGYSFGFR